MVLEIRREEDDGLWIGAYSARCWGQKETTACAVTNMAGVLHP